VSSRARVVHKRLCCVLYVQEMTHSFSTQQKTKTDNTNPKLHPYMFRVFFNDFGKTPFFFLFRLMSIPSLFLSLSLSPKLTKALLGVSTTHCLYPGSSEGERKIYTHTHICFSLPFFFLLFPFLCACVQCIFDSIRFIERETCRE